MLRSFGTTPGGQYDASRRWVSRKTNLIMTKRMTITTPRFNFPQLVCSHGWAWLAPFAWDEATQTLSRPITLGATRQIGVAIRMRQVGALSQVVVTAGEDIQPHEKEIVRKGVRRMLRLDEDFAEFHKVCAGDPQLRVLARRRCGGMLRAPELFEDLIKTVCTVNCSWGNTISMCDALCRLGKDAFPTAASLLAFNERQLAAHVPLGYRAKTVLLLSRLYDEGRLPLDDWAAQGDFARIRQTLSPLWGIGPYALNHILVLLGCYDTIPVDSVAISFLRKAHFGGKAVTPKQAVRPYDKYGQFRFLVFHFSRWGI